MKKEEKKAIYANVNSSVKEAVNKSVHPPLKFKIMKEYSNMDDLAYDELCQHVKHFMEKSSDAFHEGNNTEAAYYLVVAERFSNELKIRAILTAI